MREGWRQSLSGRLGEMEKMAGGKGGDGKREGVKAQIGTASQKEGVWYRAPRRRKAMNLS